MHQSGEVIWYRDLRGFVQPDRLPKFIPLKTDSLETQLNASLRFVLYFALLILLFRCAFVWALAVVALSMLVTVLIYEQVGSQNDRMKEHMQNLEVEFDDRTKRLCKVPTKSNPFMNVMMHEYKDFPNRPAACDVTSPKNDALSDKYFEQNLFSDSDDIFQTNTRLSKRQFYTNPATSIPNDQGSFASWLYSPALPGRTTCRDGDGDACASRIHHYYPSV